MPRIAMLAAALALCAAPMTTQAQPRAEADRYPSAAGTWQRDNDQAARAAYERGYRMGREDESRAQRGDPMDRVQRRAQQRLQRAAFELRRAILLLRMQPQARSQDGEALAEARAALRRVEQAMGAFPSRDAQREYQRRGGRGIGAERASGGWAS
ncbi:hypothetical protein [Roseomonas sp. AR75]|uniref:hypothetical protein n=1 Tax=Roseomonas sp. AR75 TaxID=2562311 RepID=UPI0010BFEBB0|nr:hypothetical protein [Roseomonas sp. AR75]